MSVVTVSTTADLQSALGAAASGDTIMLAPGSYSGLQIKSFVGDVTITSADVHHQAVVTDLFMLNSSGVHFSNLEFDRTASKDSFAFRVESSQNVSFSGLNVHGSLDNNAANDQSGFLIRNSGHVSVTDSEFHQLSKAINHATDTYLTVTGNEFHDLRSDGILGSGSAHVVISNNHFHDFHPDALDHPDAIQFWSDPGMASPVDLVIANNVIERGAGGSFQGIFMSASSGPAFTDVKITGNLVASGLGNGIAMNGGVNVTLSENTVTSLDVKSWVRLMNVETVTLSGNKAGTFLYTNVKDATLSGNTATNGSALPASDSNTTYVVVAYVAPVVEAVVGAVDDSFDVDMGEIYGWFGQGWFGQQSYATPQVQVATVNPVIPQPVVNSDPIVVFDFHGFNFGNIFL